MQGMELRQEQLKEELKSQVAFRKCGGRPGEEDVGEGVAEPAGRALWKGGSSHSPLLLERKWGATFAVKKKKKKNKCSHSMNENHFRQEMGFRF